MGAMFGGESGNGLMDIPLAAPGQRARQMRKLAGEILMDEQDLHERSGKAAFSSARV